jgi:hypothetical protein
MTLKNTLAYRQVKVYLLYKKLNMRIRIDLWPAQLTYDNCHMTIVMSDAWTIIVF